MRSPACRTGRSSGARSSRSSRRRARGARRRRDAASTSTASRRSTTRSVMRAATCCCEELGERLHGLLGDRRHGRPARRRRVRGRVAARDRRRQRARRSPSELRERIAEPFVLAGVSLEVQASVGIALSPEHGCDVDTLMRHADVAMYAGKKVHAAADLQHRRRPVLLRAARARRPAAAARSSATSSTLDFQPQLDLATGEVRTVEALVRWQHPERGRLRPDEFIPLAEHAGLIRPLTRWVLAESARPLPRLARRRPAAHRRGQRLRPRPRRSRAGRRGRRDACRARLDPRGLELEVTESTLMTDPLRATTVLEQLSGLGSASRSTTSAAATRRSATCAGCPWTCSRSTVVRGQHGDRRERRDDRPLDDRPRAQPRPRRRRRRRREPRQNITGSSNWAATAIQGYHVSEPVGASTLTGWLLSRAARATAGSSSERLMLSLKVKLVAYFLVLALLPLAAGVLGLRLVARRQRARRVDERLTAELRAANAAFHERLAGARDAAAALAAEPLLQQALQRRDATRDRAARRGRAGRRGASSDGTTYGAAVGARAARITVETPGGCWARSSPRFRSTTRSRALAARAGLAATDDSCWRAAERRWPGSGVARPFADAARAARPSTSRRRLPRRRVPGRARAAAVSRSPSSRRRRRSTRRSASARKPAPARRARRRCC